MSRQHHAASEEGDLVEVAERNGERSVDAENAHRTEARYCADADGENVRQARDCDRERRFRERLAHALFDRPPEVSLTPRRKHDEHIIDANTCNA